MNARQLAEQELRDKCFKAGMSEMDEEMCVDYFIHNLDHKTIADKYGITSESSRNKKKRFKKRLGA